MSESGRLPRLQDVISWGELTDNQVVFNHNGTLQKTYIFRGDDGSNMTEADIDYYYVGLNNIFKRLKTNYYLFIEMHKRKNKDIVHSPFSDDLLQEFEDTRHDNIINHKVYENVFYLTICYKLPSEVLQRASRIVDKSNKQILQEIKEAAKEFVGIFNPMSSGMDEILKDHVVTYDRFTEIEKKFLEECDTIAKGLSSYFVEIHACDRSETLSYLHDCISDHPVTISSNIRNFISDRIKDSVFLGGRMPKLGNKYMGIVGVKDLPPETIDFMFDRLNGLPIEYRFVIRYIALDKEQAVNETKKIIAQHQQRMKSILTVIMETINNKETGNVDRDAVLDKEDAEMAYELLSKDEFGLGYLTMNIVILNEDYNALQNDLANVRTIINDLQCVAVIEKDNATAAWLSSIPSNYENNVRSYLVNSTNLANISPLGAYYSGQKKNKHFQNLEKTTNSSMRFLDDPLFQCSTPEHLPFFFNLHIGDVGHTLIVGPTGSGKSVLLNTISANFRKYPDCKVFVFDKSASSRVLTRAIGGNFYNLLVDNSSISFQPLSNIDDPVEKTWILEWLVNYLEGANLKITPQDRNTILDALNSVAGAPKEERTLTALITMMQNETIRSGLRDLSLKGAYGSLFDSNKDKFGSGRWQVFEMEKLMENSKIVAPTLDYLFHRIEGQLDGYPALMVLDECWLFLRNDAFRSKIVEYLKDLRKKNCAVVMATQNLSDMDEKLIPVVSSNCLTKIFLPNSSINDLAYSMYQRFDLNNTEISLLGSIKPKRQYFYKSAQGTRVFDLTLSPLELAFLGATSKEDQLNVARMKDLSREEFVSNWKVLKHVV